MDKKHEERMEQSSKIFLSRKQLSVTTIKNGIILPAHTNSSKLWADGGVVNANGKYIEDSGNGYLFGGKYNYDSSEIIESNETVVFFGPFIEHWGHFICDLIGRMWFVKDNPKKYKIAYCGWNWHQGTGDIKGNYLELLKLLGIQKKQLINIQKPTRFKKIIIPDLAFSGGNYYTKEFKDMISIIVSNSLVSKIKTPSKVYFSRTKFNNGKERGEEKIEKIFKANGYEVVYPESLSVKEQITYLNKAQEIAMVSGSLSHNLMFSKNEKLHAIILNKMSLVNNYQSVIDDMTNIKITYIDSFFSPLQVLFGAGPFLLSNTKHLRQFIKDNNYNLPKTCNISLKDIAWYFKKYQATYRNPNNKTLLNNQKEAIKSSSQD